MENGICKHVGGGDHRIDQWERYAVERWSVLLHGNRFSLETRFQSFAFEDWKRVSKKIPF